MNKKLLTLAVGAALASAPMFASAAVTVYGTAHMSIDYLDDGQATDNTLLTLSSNSTFIGFKAEEDLGGGMKALAGAELQFAMDQAATGFTNRNVFAGLSGGNYDDIMKQVGRKVDFFMNEQLGESRSLTAGNAMDARLANSINYESPKLGPVMITANYGMATSANESLGQDLTAYAIGAQLDMGGLYVGAAYKSRDIDIGATKEAATSYRLTASYTIGAFKVGGLFQNATDDTPAGTANDIDLNVYGIGASFKFGNSTVKAQYYVADESIVASSNGATLMAIGYDYNLSKTTVVYATYAAVENDVTGAYSVISAGHSNNPAAGGDIVGFNPVANDTNSGFSVGVRVAF
jgi:predicted porin